MCSSPPCCVSHVLAPALPPSSSRCCCPEVCTQKGSKFGLNFLRIPHLPCPSFPWSFRRYPGKPQKHQRFFLPCEPLKTPGKQKQRTPKKTEEFRSERNTKETKTTRERRTGFCFVGKKRPLRVHQEMPSCFPTQSPQADLNRVHA